MTVESDCATIKDYPDRQCRRCPRCQHALGGAADHDRGPDGGFNGNGRQSIDSTPTSSVPVCPYTDRRGPCACHGGGGGGGDGGGSSNPPMSTTCATNSNSSVVEQGGKSHSSNLFREHDHDLAHAVRAVRRLRELYREDVRRGFRGDSKEDPTAVLLRARDWFCHRLRQYLGYQSLYESRDWVGGVERGRCLRGLRDDLGRQIGRRIPAVCDGQGRGDHDDGDDDGDCNDYVAITPAVRAFYFRMLWDFASVHDDNRKLFFRRVLWRMAVNERVRRDCRVLAQICRERSHGQGQG